MFSEWYEQTPTNPGLLYFYIAISYIAMQIYKIYFTSAIGTLSIFSFS